MPTSVCFNTNLIVQSNVSFHANNARDYELYDFILDDNSLTGVDVTNNIKGVSSINALFGMQPLIIWDH